MRILHVVSGLGNSGGVEAFVKNLVNNINLKEFQLDFLVTSNNVGELEPSFVQKGCNVYHLKCTNRKERIKARNSFFKEHKNEWDIVHIHTVLTTAFSAAYGAKKYAKAKSVIVHSHTSNNYEGWRMMNDLCRPILNLFTDYRVACSIDSGIFLFGLKYKKQIRVIFNAVDVEKFYINQSLGNEYKEKLNLKGRKVIGHVGRLTEAKNHKFLINLFNEILKIDDNYRLVLVGDGEYLDKIKNQIRELQLEERVLLLGSRSDIPELMNMFDIFVFPSVYEGLPTVLIEAQCVGLPIVCSNVITDEVIVNNNVEKLDLSDYSKWVETITTMTKIQNISDKVELFDNKNISKQVETLYQEVYNHCK